MSIYYHINNYGERVSISFPHQAFKSVSAGSTNHVSKIFGKARVITQQAKCFSLKHKDLNSILSLHVKSIHVVGTCNPSAGEAETARAHYPVNLVYLTGSQPERNSVSKNKVDSSQEKILHMHIQLCTQMHTHIHMCTCTCTHTHIRKKSCNYAKHAKNFFSFYNQDNITTVYIFFGSRM